MKHHHFQFILGFEGGVGFSSFELDLASLSCSKYHCSLKAVTVKLLRLLAGQRTTKWTSNMPYSPQSGEGEREAKHERIILNSARTTSHGVDSWQEPVPCTGRKCVLPLCKAGSPPGKSSAGDALLTQG